MAYMHAQENSVTGTSLLTPLNMGANFGSEKIKMYEDSFGIAYGMKF
jgi:hypothetical protein